MTNFSYSIDMVCKVCPTCHMPYAAPESFFTAKYNARGKKRTWYCPAGHKISYTKPKVAPLKVVV